MHPSPSAETRGPVEPSGRMSISAPYPCGLALRAIHSAAVLRASGRAVARARSRHRYGTYLVLCCGNDADHILACGRARAGAVVRARRYPRRRADVVAKELELDLNAVGICHACLCFVSFALDDDSPHKLNGELRRMT